MDRVSTRLFCPGAKIFSTCTISSYTFVECDSRNDKEHIEAKMMWQCGDVKYTEKTAAL